MLNSAVLFSEMTPQRDWEDRFNRWYDDHHIPIRMDVNGFVGAQRYLRNTRSYLAVYDLTSTAVLESPSYDAIKKNPSETTEWMLRSVDNFTRYIGSSIGVQHKGEAAEMLAAPLLYSVFFTVPDDQVEEFDAWYDEDHVPTLLEAEQWLGCRRFSLEVSHPVPFNRLALHYLSDAGALESPARRKARSSQWRERLAKQDWFSGAYAVFDRHGSRFTSTAAPNA